SDDPGGVRDGHVAADRAQTARTAHGHAAPVGAAAERKEAGERATAHAAAAAQGLGEDAARAITACDDVAVSVDHDPAADGAVAALQSNGQAVVVFHRPIGDLPSGAERTAAPAAAA